MKRKTSGLFPKAILALSAVSIVPVVLIAWHVLRVDSRVLQSEILDKQRTVAGQIASVVSEEVSHYVQFFSVFADLHNDFTGHHSINKEDIDYLRRENPSFSHISILNPSGRQLFYSSDKKSRLSYATELANILRACVEQGREYVGSVSRSDGKLFVLMAFPLRENPQEQQVSGVLLAEINLERLGLSLEKVYPKDMFATVTSADGKVVSYTGAPFGLAIESNRVLQNETRELEQALDGREGARIKLSNSGKVLASQAKVPSLNWTVFVEQPENTITKLFLESTFHSIWDMLGILLVMAVFVILVSYLVIRPIVRPVKRLKEVAVKYERERDYVPTEKDLIIPNNEIGELERVFLHMAEVLTERRNVIVKAQRELAAMNKDLEQRVQERTAELKAATDELVSKERLAAIGQMASIISHEIRNPLAVISNATRLIKTIEPPTEPKIIKQFSIIEAEIKQANSIISEVLGYARSRDLMLSIIDLNSYIHEIVASFPVSSEVRMIEELDPENARLKIDAEEIKQAVRNVISNACEAVQGAGQIRIGTQVGKKAVCIYVEDNGPGINAELKEKIFSAFFTTKARGTGLGLAVVRKAVTRHKGKLFIHSEEGKGTCFAMYFRIYKKTGDTKYG
ncbi:MAG: GHKL domain-containing protein [Elusimicrobiaceae bacterium]|nr:GHKL domain-containing protein [Elusimicrobiaceae bacterium]